VNRILGIDLGTTNSAAAFLDGEEPRIIPNDRGNRITPSIVAFLGENEVLVGEAAKNQAVINIEKTVLSIKRHMGTDRTYTIDGITYRPEQVSARILQKLRYDAENYLGEPVDQAVITVPAYFSEKQRRATQEAGKLAGLKVRRIINEPTAAALAYAYEIERNSNILVYDLGGGTFDVTFLVKEGDRFEVKATCGDNTLGGVDFDDRLLDAVVKDFSEKSGMDLGKDRIILQQLREQVEKAKIELSSRETAMVALPFAGGGSQPVHLSFTITRKFFEDLIRKDIERTVELSLKAVREAGAKPKNVQSLILAGGSSRIPLVRRLLAAEFDAEPEKKINPEEVVALGASVQASILSGEIGDIALKDITPFPLGLEIEGGRFFHIIEKNSPLPVQGSRVFTTVTDRQSSVEIHVLQGEAEKAPENTSLGRFLLSGIREGRRGEPRIKVDFTIDADGLLEVKAKDVDTGVHQQVTVTAGFGGNDEDDSFKALAELKNRIQSLVLRIEDLSTRHANNIDSGFKKEIHEVISTAKGELLKGNAKGLRENGIALETILAELQAISQIDEELGFGQA